MEEKEREEAAAQMLVDALNNWSLKNDIGDTAGMHVNGDGSISQDELVAILTRKNPSTTTQQAEALFTKFDTTGDGRIDYEEFVSFVCEPKPASPTRGRAARRREQISTIEDKLRSVLLALADEGDARRIACGRVR